MTTTDLYSGYDRDGKPTSRVLRPPGGGSSNIFGSEPAPQQQLRQQEQKSLDQNQNQGEQVAPQAPSQQQGNTQEDIHSRHRPRKQDEAPYAENDMENPHDRHGTSQNEKDFRCHSVTAYREAVVRNAEIRDRAYSSKATAFNPITHQEQNGEAPHNPYINEYAPPPKQAYQPNQDYGKNREGSALPRHSFATYRDAVVRNAEIRQKYPGGQASASFNPITHEQYDGDGPLPQHYQQAAPPPPQANVEPEQAYGRRDKPVRAQAYNPITGEEYPQDYGQKQSPAAKKTEDPDKTAVNNETCTPTPSVTPSGTPSGTPFENPMGTPGSGVRTSSRVLQPPGGATTTKLW